jgi:hypothetical protein
MGVEGRADYELGASKNCNAGGFRIKNRSCPEQNRASRPFRQVLDDPGGPRDCEGNFKSGNSSQTTGFGDVRGLIRAFRPNDSNQPGRDNFSEDFNFLE